MVLANPDGMGEVSETDFSDERLSSAFREITPLLASTPAGTPVDIAHVSDPQVQGTLRALALDERPLPDWQDMETRLVSKRLDHEIDELESKLAGLEAGSESHSETLRRLIALQQEKRSTSSQ